MKSGSKPTCQTPRLLLKISLAAKDHYQVEVVSKAFSGMKPLARHRKVYGIFSDVVGGDLHALSLKTRAPGE